MFDFTQLVEAVQAGDEAAARELTDKALEQGNSPDSVLKQGLVAAMDLVGNQFKNNVIFLPEMMVAANAMKKALTILRPRLAETGSKPVGRAVIATVKGDLHDIGKNTFGMMLEGAGFEITDLGIDVTPEQIIDEVRKEDCRILGLSAMLSTTMPQIETTIKAIREAGLRNKIHILVGGAPVTQEFADRIGADGYADDAATGAQMAREKLAEV